MDEFSSEHHQDFVYIAKAMIKRGWIPPHSPFSLIQESLFPNEWLIFVSCLLLNRTSRKQVEKVFPSFQERWCSPDAFLRDDKTYVQSVIKSLGFVNRRYDILRKFAHAFKEWDGREVRDLPGVGEYAARAWEIFCQGELGKEPPEDGALVKYWHWVVDLRDKHGQARS